MSTRTLEELQQIVADESRSNEDRKQAAEHIISLQSAPEPPADKEEADRAMIRRIFADMLGWDGTEERKRREREDATTHVCSSCFLLQPKTNILCEVCASNEWLVPSQAKNDPEQALFINMAASYTVEQLKTALYSGWTRTPERERVTRLLFSCRQGKLKPQAIVESSAEPDEVQTIDFDGLLARCDREIAALEKGY